MPMTEAEGRPAPFAVQNSREPDCEGADHPARGHNEIDEPTLCAEHHAFGHRPHLQTQISEAV